jgi:MSHA pilin protein MshA
MKKQQSGFTLIELIIVIVILGLLAVTAAPKFIDIQSDAKASTIEGVKAALQGGSKLVFAKSAIAGKQKNATGVAGAAAADSQVTIGTLTVETNFGYPSAASFTAIRTAALAGSDVAVFAELDESDWDLDDSYPAAGSFTITPQGIAAAAAPTGGDDDTRCQITYTNSTGANDTPDIVTATGGC